MLMEKQNKLIKLISFYLPQYHTIEENNRWWGKGFTEWTNVKKAKSQFAGHQIHKPSESIGYYDLRESNIKQKQADLAAQYGIYGFCYYYYWFAGKKLLETPLQQILKTGKPDFPFCVCWANENWTRRWDGLDEEVLIAQDHRDDNDVAFIEDLIPILKDERYIKIDGKPLLVIYRTGLFPDIKKSAGIWRKVAKSNGLKGLYLVRVEGIEEGLEPSEIDFDAAIEFAPDWRQLGEPVNNRKFLYEDTIKDSSIYQKKTPTVADYDQVIERIISRDVPNYKYFRGVFPSWDNSPRRGKVGTIFFGSSPDKFCYFLKEQIKNTIDNKLLKFTEKIIFINAWNEWGEGCHLEPDTIYGTAWLEAVKSALDQRNDSNSKVDKQRLRELRQLYLKSVDGIKTKEDEGAAEKNELISAVKKLRSISDQYEQLADENKSIKNSRIWKTRNKLAKYLKKKVIE